MQIAETYSHFNGLEYLLVHKPQLWREIQEVISLVDFGFNTADKSGPAQTLGTGKRSAIQLNKQFRRLLGSLGWKARPVTMHEGPEDQKAEIEAAGHVPIRSYNQTDFVKERIALEVQFGKYSFVAYDLFVKHLAFYVRDEIDVGIEILAMKSMQAMMSSGPGYYEGELYNVIRNGRGVPGVPLVMIGVLP
jgi:hypothetical protein